MNRKTIAELMQVDSRTGLFGPEGLMTDRRLTDESAVSFIQGLVEGLDLPSSVPEEVRGHFDTLRHLHTYGAFSYDLFGMCASAADMTIEFVLGVRFVEWHSGRVPLVEHGTGKQETVPVDDYAQLVPRLGRRRPDGTGGWHLKGDSHFDGSLASLLRWGRTSGVLSGWLGTIWSQAYRNILSTELTQSGSRRRIPAEWETWTSDERTHWIETSLRPDWEQEYLDNIRQLRNVTAHRTSHFITYPPDSARTLRWLAEVITAMWPPADEPG
ncbi:MAG: hypothetical protein ABSA21_13965 [Candidatus Limnocylindrales bacterium]